ncbi:MAG: amidohydrolase [Fusobacteriaceae bacterium]|jgi:amidohydrolase|nr:amidohydrolase [Fusobacteriaceae bacterium]
MDKKLEDKIFQNVKKNIEWTKGVRHQLHQYPELDFKLTKTIEIISKYLDEIGIKYRKAVNDSAIIADIDGRDKSKTIALRADIDALPILESSSCPFPSKNIGNMHACGHDVHATVVLGVLKNLIENKEELPCNVRVLFQPAEETSGGAVPLINEGALDGVNYIYGLHVDPNLECGKIAYQYGTAYATSAGVNVKITGKSAHGAAPQFGVDAIVVASNIVTALQSVVSRNTSPNDAIVLTFGVISGGTKENIIAKEVNLNGTIRALSDESKEVAKKQIINMVENIASGYGAKGEVYIKDGYICLTNHNECIDIVRDNGIHLLGSKNVLENTIPTMGVEDFSYYLKKIPGAFFSLGVRNEALGIVAALHNEKFNIDENALEVGVKMGILNIFNTYDKLISK